MSSLNQVQLIGNLGRDPDIRYTANSDPVANFTMATSEKWKDKVSGDAQEKTEWHRVVVFGNLAKVVADYVKKGTKVFIQGKLQTRKWTDKEGAEKYTTEVVLSGWGGKLVMLGGGDNSNRPPAQGSKEKPAAETAEAVDEFDDNIPF